MILDYANNIKVTPEAITDSGISQENAENIGWVVKHHEFDDDIRAYQLLSHYGVDKDTPSDKLSKIKDIYNWTVNGDVDDIISVINEHELRIGTPVGIDKLNYLWQYLALDRQEKEAKRAKQMMYGTT